MTTTETLPTIDGDVIAELVVAELTGVKRRGDDFYAMSASAGNGCITLTVTQVRFGGENPKVQVVLQSAAPVAIREKRSVASVGIMDLPAESEGAA